MENYWHQITPDVYSLPAHINPHPQCWSRDDVITWAEWCRKEFSLEMKAEQFAMNGKALCMLTKEDFKQRAPEAGDVLFNTLKTLLARVACSDASARWRSPGLLHGHSTLPLDMVMPPDLEYNYVMSRYGRSLLSVCGSRSPPSSPLSSQPPGSPADHLPARIPISHPGFLPWDYRTPRLSSRIVPLSSSPETDKQQSSHSENQGNNFQNTDSNQGVDYTSKSQKSESVREDTCYKDNENRTDSSSPQHRGDKQGTAISPGVHIGGYPMTAGMKEQINYRGEVAVYENRPQTYHVVKDEPADAAAARHSLHGHPMAPPFDSISPPSSPDSQVLPSPVQDERVSPENGMMDSPKGLCTEEESWGTHSNNNVPYLKGSRKLWEFLWGLMENPSSFKSVIRWEDKSQGIFRILNTTVLAQLWGRQKNKNNMTYEKMSRALRYYYRMNILNKVPGKRLTYRFATDPNGINDMKRWARINKQSQQDTAMDR